MMQLIFIILTPFVFSICIPPLNNPFLSSISLNTPTSSELGQALNQFTSNQPDPSSALGFFKPTLPYLIPVAIISGLALIFGIVIIWKKIKKQPLLKIGNNQCKKSCYYFVILIVILLGICLIISGILNILATQSTSQQLEYLNCVSVQKLNGYKNGVSQNWIGANNLVSNATSIRLSFINNIKQLKNGLQGLAINGSKLGIPVNVTHPTMKQVAETNMQRWLLMNSSVSSVIRAPICQTTPYTVPHPVDNTRTVTFPMMTTICQNLTKQVNNIIDNSLSLDYLLANYTNLISNITNINNSLSSFESNYTNYKMAYDNYNSTNLQIPYLSLQTSFNKLSYFLSSICLLTGVLCIIISIQIMLKTKPSSHLVFSITYGLLFLLIIVCSIVCVYYIIEGNVFKYVATIYQKLPSSQFYSTLSNIYSFPSSVSNSVYTCITNSSARFIQSDLSTLKTFTTLKQLYVNSTPPDLLNSQSIKYTNLSIEYLADLSKVAISDTSVNLSILLSSVNKLANYNLTNSTQIPCNAAMDQFYYNPLNCTSHLLDPSNVTDITIRQPRCIQIPSGQRQSGSISTSLNQIQNVYNISNPGAGSCNTISNFFNHSDCFFQKRITSLFASSDCVSKGTVLSQSIKNLVRFSISAGDVWDVYTQNLRNYLGVYLVLNTNITSFYTTPNVTEAFNSFSVPSSNIIEKSGCAYINQSVNQIYKQILNSIDYFLKIAVVTFSVVIGSFLLMFLVWYLQSRKLGSSRVENNSNRNSRGQIIFYDSALNDQNITMENIKQPPLLTQQQIKQSPRIHKRIKKHKTQKEVVEQNKTKKQSKKMQNQQKNPHRESKSLKQKFEPGFRSIDVIEQMPLQNTLQVKQFPIHPIQFNEQKQIKHKINQNNKKLSLTARPGEFASSSVRNIRNLILFDDNKNQQSESQDIIIENLKSHQFQNNGSQEHQSESKDKQQHNSNQEEEQSWVSGTLSSPNNKQ